MAMLDSLFVIIRRTESSGFPWRLMLCIMFVAVSPGHPGAESGGMVSAAGKQGTGLFAAPPPTSISSDGFARRVCSLGTTRKIVAGGKIVFMCRQKTAVLPEGVKPKTRSSREGISAECTEGTERKPVDCVWKCVADGYDDCRDFLEACTAAGGRTDGETEDIKLCKGGEESDN